MGDLTREWAAMGGLDTYRRLGSVLQYRAATPIAQHADDDLIQRAFHMKPDDVTTLLEGLRTGIEKLGAVADRLTASTSENNTPEPTIDSSRAGKSPTPRSASDSASNDDDLRSRVSVAVRRPSACCTPQSCHPLRNLNICSSYGLNQAI